MNQRQAKKLIYQAMYAKAIDTLMSAEAWLYDADLSDADVARLESAMYEFADEMARRSG